MFNNSDLYPTPLPVMELMIQGEDLTGKVILEPEAGLGNIVDFCYGAGAAAVIACEMDKNLQKILQTKCKIIADDFLTVSSDKISHIDYIIMNPPFSADEKHINHAFEIAPPGCKIIALCNSSTIENLYSAGRKQLKATINNYGSTQDLGQCFKDAERETGVEVTMIKLTKPGENYKAEFDGFFLEEEPEEVGANGIMSYNVVRDLVNRYVAAIKLYDQQLELGVKMNSLMNGYYGEVLTFTCSTNGVPTLRNEFKKGLQHAGWKFIFDKMNLQKYATRGMRDDINKFVEQQTHIPFTMKNIYHMLDIVIGTAGQQMDKALLAVFDKLTEHHHDNRFNVEGWKTNSHYLVNRKFILPNMCYQDQRWYKGQSNIQIGYGNYFDLIEDLTKALCYITGDKYEKLGSLSSWMRYRYKIITDDEVFYVHHTEYRYDSLASKREELYKKGIANKVIDHEPVYGEWFEWAYFRCKAFKKGSMHFEFKDEDLWGKFNQRISKLKGYPLYEPKKQTKYQERQTGRDKQEKSNPAHAFKPTVLYEI